MRSPIRGDSKALACTAALLLGTSFANADIALKFLGTAVGGEVEPIYQQQIDDSMIDLSGFACFQAPLYDLENGHQVGTGVDCLRTFDDTGPVGLEAKTFFFLPQGMLVNRGCTSVSPMVPGVGDNGVTHVTGSIPVSEFGDAAASVPVADCTGETGIIHATGGFKNFTGGARLSGAVNLSNLTPEHPEITFSCLFVIDLEPPRGPRVR